MLQPHRGQALSTTAEWCTPTQPLCQILARMGAIPLIRAMRGPTGLATTDRAMRLKRTPLAASTRTERIPRSQPILRIPTRESLPQSGPLVLAPIQPITRPRSTPAPPGQRKLMKGLLLRSSTTAHPDRRAGLNKRKRIRTENHNSRELHFTRGHSIFEWPLFLSDTLPGSPGCAFLALRSS